jgi:hypothetical protein
VTAPDPAARSDASERPVCPNCGAGGCTDREACVARYAESGRLLARARGLVGEPTTGDGPVLGEDVRHWLGTDAAWKARHRIERSLADAETLAGGIDAVMYEVAALLVQARADGAAEERGRAQSEIDELRRTIQHINAARYEEEDPW